MIASLMMYQRPQLAGAHDRFWALIRTELAATGIDAPDHLSQDADEFSVWKSPDLVLSQTCGMPYRLWLHDQVGLVGTPDYGLKDCPPGFYRSALVVRATDARTELTAFKDATFAFNEAFSQSGFAAPYHHTGAIGSWFQNRVRTGAHLLSAKAVAEGRADIAALDAVTWRNIERYGDIAQDLRVLDWTVPTPGLPLITAARQDAGLIYGAVRRAIDALSVQDAADLGMRGIVAIPKQAYLAVPNPPRGDQS
ncbi:phosphate/phosphite/phosphonate ABC transporter substrate-binding protein [Octadecabacter sp. G9-8]|uniref:Phosphate/phosphite/phosphonate ABC transporter substrate-binding protein n=1 Tax=Octadecabacter dasysiphoniae TaxID=2909341 RepID=A0ABS9CXX0_9RHOB|nr:PhnD/SsuA/transferrin family substrate-binding protein [Octadecabacter dasysiphoniae]MCF2872078.1 phosphate/phosphite/phosphonate ABC transporter substrate-binding protein [Octadecabacter dasysiphoniae]